MTKKEVPDGYTSYNGHLMKIQKPKLTKKRQLWLLDNHPCFTGCCHHCGYIYPTKSSTYPTKPSKWDCPQCGTSYDS